MRANYPAFPIDIDLADIKSLASFCYSYLIQGNQIFEGGSLSLEFIFARGRMFLPNKNSSIVFLTALYILNIHIF